MEIAAKSSGVNVVDRSDGRPGAVLTDAVMPLRITILEDRAEPAREGPATLLRFKAVGSVADALYQSGRVILADAQARAVRMALDSKRQQTLFVGHPNTKQMDEGELHVGRLEETAGVIEQYHFDAATKQTCLDEVRVLDTPKGRVARDLIRSGVQVGISQRAAGFQEAREWKDAGGVAHRANVVTDLTGIYGWDMVHLPDANAGDVTEVEPLADSVVSALATAPAPAVAAAEPDATTVEEGWGTPPADHDLTDAELNEFAPLRQDGNRPASDGGAVTDRAVAVHNPDKADVGVAWNPTQAEINRLPNGAFGWLDDDYLAGKTKDLGRSRKLPHHLPNGKTVWRGVRAAMAILNGARGGLKIPQKDRDGVYKHLAAHYKQFGHEAPALRDVADLPESARNKLVTAAPFDSARREAPMDKTAVDAANLSKLVEANAALADSNRMMLKAMEAKLEERKQAAGVQDSITSRVSAENSRQNLWEGALQTVRLALEELEDLCEDQQMSVADKNSKLAKMGEEMKGLFAKMTDEFVNANKQTEATNESASSAAAAASAGKTDAAAPAPAVPAPTVAPAASAPAPVVPAVADAAPAAAAVASVPPPVPVVPVVADAVPAPVAPAVAPAATEAKDAASSTAKAPVAYVPPPAPVPAPTVVVVPAAGVMEEKITTSRKLVDAINAAVAEDKRNQQLRDNRAYAREAVTRQKLDEKTSAAVLDNVLKGVSHDSTREKVEDAVKDAMSLLNLGRVEERLDTMGFTNRGEGSSMQRITDMKPVSSLGAPHLTGVKLLTDSFVASGKMQMAHPEEGKIPTYLSKMLKRFDDHFAAELRKEQEKLDSLGKGLNGKNLFDASTAADLDYPHTISRIVLFEVYAGDIVPKITDFGVMDNDRDQVPITRWRQEAGASLLPTFRPSVFQRASVKVPELGAIPRGKLSTEFFAIDARARKMAATLSDEFLTRAKRRPDISGSAMAVSNLIDDIRRIIQMDVFFEWIRAGLAHGGSAFDVLIAGTSTDTYQVIGTTAANAVSIVPNDERTPLIVELGTTSANRTAVPEFGTQLGGGGPGNAYFYVVNHALSKISFVDAAGAALATVTAADVIRVRGTKADAEVRFNLNLPGTTTQQQHMQALNFAIQNQRAKMSSGGISAVGYYDADTVLASVVNSEFLKQAEMYAAHFRREGFAADKVITEGNYGVTAGLGHWGSKIMPDDFVILGDSKGVLFRTYEPLNLRGPIEGRDATGQLNGSKEWYSYQEDSLATPLIQKFCALTLYRA